MTSSRLTEFHAESAIPRDHRSSLDATDLAALVADVASRPAEWQAEVRFGADARWWTRLRRDELVDVWLLTWVYDTGSDLHDHGPSAGAFTVVVGELEEVRPDGPDHELVPTTLRAGDVRQVERGVVHDVRSPSTLPAVSIHAYSPPLREMTFFEQHPSGPRPTRTVTTQSEGTLA
jgi:mannose-6-phosphate isomerase-like protein (cupin superfamily)